MTGNKFSKSTWVKEGLIWGVFMFMIMTFILPYFKGEEIITRDILVGLVIWSIGGLLFGYTMKLYKESITNIEK